MYHICGIFWYHDARFCTTYVVSFWYHKRARNPLLMFRSQKTWYHRMEGNGRRLSCASRCMWINPLDVHSPKFIHIFFGDDVFFGVFFNFMQVMTCDMGTSPGHRRGGLIFCILRGLSSPHRKNLLRGSFSIGIFRDILTSIHKHISRYLYHRAW